MDLFKDELLGALADKLGKDLVLGRGKKERIIKDLSDKLGSKCPYCSSILSPSNSVYDHKKAIGSKRARKALRGNQRAFDDWDNIHLICTPCNKLKSDLDHEEFIGFVEYLNRFPTAKRKFKVRFRKERMSYKRR
jgi:5-methylcytosine-specific restriction endonuclease McrA